MESPRLFSFRRLVLPVVAMMLITFGPVLPPASADSVLTRIPIASPVAVAVNPVTNEIYVASAGNNTLMEIDGTTDAVSRIFPVGIDPKAVGVDPETGTIYEVSYEGSSMTAIDEKTASISNLNVGGRPVALTVDQAIDK